MNTKTLIQRSVYTLVPALALLLAPLGPIHASPVGGAKYGSGTVNAFSTTSYNVLLYGGEVSVVTVSGDRDTDLDLYVYDQYGRLIASDTDYTDQCVVVFTAPQYGNYTVVIKNRGSVYNQYQIDIL